MIEQAGATLLLVTIFGSPGSALGYAIRDFLYRSDVAFEWVQLLSDAQARSDAGVENLADTRLPICVFADGTLVSIAAWHDNELGFANRLAEVSQRLAG